MASSLPSTTEQATEHANAARCISIELMGKKFHPEFTHQCFPGECIRGYTDEDELDVYIRLSPSCRHCQVDVTIQSKEPPPKRPRLAENAKENEAQEETPDEPMSVEEILKGCSKALPSMQALLKDDDYLDAPIGNIIQEYQVHDLDFVISLADGPEASAYHDQVQKLALWFIETADDVDVASKEGGYWKVMYLWHKVSPKQHALAGYVTLFHFFAPFKKPKSGIVARMCQALLLPPYQRMGHGTKLLQTIYSKLDNEVVEINVEDPAPSFVALRNCVDYLRFCDNTWLDSKYYEKDSTSANFFLAVSDADAVQAGVLARTTPRQVQVAHELYKLAHLKNANEILEKQYRLMVKKRLAKVHREDLGGCSTKEEKQAILQTLFQETLKQYKDILKLD